MRRSNRLGRTQISLPGLRSLLRNLLRRRSVLLTQENFRLGSRCAPSSRRIAKNFSPRLCKTLRFMLWSQVMSAVPRSDRDRDGQSGELKKGNTHKTSRFTSTMAIAWPQHSGGSIATARRAPHFFLSSLLPVPGLVGARASTVSVALTRVRRRRTSGRPGESH